ncbi:MAG TPA: type II toxin-antitoxin system prevent-host-death family antitoxin [Candidatus Limnocylindria bacterium]|nr:type II toxin-antitoxin system prevent-host-death family antitoxin [Candidatus Limnocylindria bacterium]
MSERGGSVGVRELRQNLSVYLRRVKGGESLDVTERGRPVARLVPVKRAPLWDQMVADGRITPARTPGDLPNAIALPGGHQPPSEALRQMREEERW